MALNLDIDEKLIRAVPLPTMLQKYGELLNPPDASWTQGGTESEKVLKELYETSVPASRIDYFLSHSWRDSAWCKYVIVCWEANIRRHATGPAGHRPDLEV